MGMYAKGYIAYLYVSSFVCSRSYLQRYPSIFHPGLITPKGWGIQLQKLSYFFGISRRNRMTCREIRFPKYQRSSRAISKWESPRTLRGSGRTPRIGLARTCPSHTDSAESRLLLFSDISAFSSPIGTGFPLSIPSFSCLFLCPEVYKHVPVHFLCSSLCSL